MFLLLAETALGRWGFLQAFASNKIEVFLVSELLSLQGRVARQRGMTEEKQLMVYHRLRVAGSSSLFLLSHPDCQPLGCTTQNYANYNVHILNPSIRCPRFSHLQKVSPLSTWGFGTSRNIKQEGLSGNCVPKCVPPNSCVGSTLISSATAFCVGPLGAFFLGHQDSGTQVD